MKPKVKKYKRGGSVQIEPIEDMRKIIIEVLAEGHNMDHVHAVMKMDVTKPRKYLREYKRKTRQNISFTAFIIHSLAHAINTYKRMHAYRTKRKIYIFDEVDVATIVERDSPSGRKVPTTKILRKCNYKSLEEINKEIRSAQSEKLQGISLGNSKQAKRTNFMIKLPRLLRKPIWWYMRRSPKFKKNNIGTISVTSIGMFTDGDTGWAIPLGPWSLFFVIGPIEKNHFKVNGTWKEREQLNCVMSVDHSVVDGGPSTRFIMKFKSILKNGQSIKKMIDAEIEKNHNNE